MYILQVVVGPQIACSTFHFIFHPYALHTDISHNRLFSKMDRQQVKNTCLLLFSIPLFHLTSLNDIIQNHFTIITGSNLYHYRFRLSYRDINKLYFSSALENETSLFK